MLRVRALFRLLGRGHAADGLSWGSAHVSSGGTVRSFPSLSVPLRLLEGWRWISGQRAGRALPVRARHLVWSDGGDEPDRAVGSEQGGPGLSAPTSGRFSFARDRLVEQLGFLPSVFRPALRFVSSWGVDKVWIQYFVFGLVFEQAHDLYSACTTCPPGCQNSKAILEMRGKPVKLRHCRATVIVRSLPSRR